MSGIQNPVLVVIDMQKGFLNEYSSHVVHDVHVLVRDCQARNVRVVFSRFFNVAGSPYETLIGWNHVQDAPETDIVDQLAPFAETLINKSFYSALTAEFIDLVKRNDWKTIILCGIATESCVLKTAADAFELGLRPIVISDASASDMGRDSHAAGLLALESLIGKDQIMSTHELIAQLDGQS